MCSSAGKSEKIRNLAKTASDAGIYNVAFLCYFLLVA
jgi:hypothetical protein